MAAVTEQEFKDWLEHPVTVQLKKQMKKDLDMMQGMLIYCGEEDLKGIQNRCQAAIKLIDLEYKDLYE